jgi:hypothetical protein
MNCKQYDELKRAVTENAIKLLKNQKARISMFIKF